MDDGHHYDWTAAFRSGGRPYGDGLPDAVSHELSQLLLSASAIGIVAVDNNGIIRSCNPAAEELLARPERELLGLPLGLPTVVDETSEIDLMMPDGGVREVEIWVSTTTWDEQQALVGDGSDDEDLPGIRSILEQQSTVVAVIAYELDHRLAAINLAIHQLRADDITDRRRAELVNRLDVSVQHTQALVRKLHFATRIHTNQTPVTSGSVRLFNFLLERLHEIREKSREVRLFYHGGIVVFVDRIEFAYMLDTYLRNALTHGQPPIDLSATEEDGWVVIRVCDYGPGVSDELLPHLFDRYRPMEDGPQRNNSVGQGLWVTRSLARVYGGDAWYEPRRPYGSCFCLRLPANSRAGR
jgi:signal transduction histidine kinase